MKGMEAIEKARELSKNDSLITASVKYSQYGADNFHVECSVIVCRKCVGTDTETELFKSPSFTGCLEQIKKYYKANN